MRARTQYAQPLSLEINEMLVAGTSASAEWVIPVNILGLYA
jgi:hypothetical protein